MTTERRRFKRYPASFYIRLAIDEHLHRCYLTDLSAMGLYAQRPIEPLKRNSRLAQAEIRLPGTGYSLWAAAELVYDRFDDFFHGSAFRFTAMAGIHQKILRHWLLQNHGTDRTAGYQPFPRFGEVIVLRPGVPSRAAA